MTWAPDYVTAAQLKEYVRIADAVDDAELATAITAASRAIDNRCNRQFGKVAAPEERTYTAFYNYARSRWAVWIDDLQSTVGVIVSADGSTVTDYTLEPRNAVAKGKAWTLLVFGADITLDDDEIAMTAPWGWTTVPVAVFQACKFQTSRFLGRRDSPFGIAGSPDQGSELRLLARVDPDVAVSLGGYVRPRRVF